MKVNELRIGNYLLLNGREVIIDLVDRIEKLINRSSVDVFNPIPLTEEILFKTEFKKELGSNLSIDSFDEIFWIEGLYFIENDGGYFYLYRADDENTYFLIARINYLHELQNIIFYLRKKELEINL